MFKNGGSAKMFQSYESIPFGVIVLRGSALIIQYFNKRAKSMLNLEDDIINKNLDVLTFLQKFSTILLKCFMEKTEQKLYGVELIENKYYSVKICGEEEQVLIYLDDITENVVISKEQIEDGIKKLNKEKKKFLNISTELKTKCDIIEILRAREKEHLMHLKDVINNISEGLIVADKKGKLSLCNRAAYSICELKMGELLYVSSTFKKYNVYMENEKDIVDKNYYENLYTSTMPLRNLILKLEDKQTCTIKYVEISSNPIFGLNDEHLYTIITLKDVTAAKLHEINAAEQSNFIKNLINNLDVPIAVIDCPELTYKLVNKKHSVLLKNVNESVNYYKNKKAYENYFNDNIYSILSVVRDKGKEFTLSPYVVLDESSNERFYKLRFIPYKDAEDTVKTIYMHGLDITEEVNHNMELEKVTKLKDEFFTVISHELRTPLTIIYSSLQLVYDVYKNEITPNVDKTLKRIDQNCGRLLKLINNILDISKAEAGFLSLNCSNFDIVYITEFITNSVNLYAESKQIELIFDTTEEECVVYLDKDKYEKILLNLLSNAIKFTPEGRQILVTLYVKDEYVTLSVKDQGIGIPEDKLVRIFDRFSQINTSLTRRAEGTGLGLSLVKKLVESMDGDIKVKSKEGAGSEFFVRLSKICSACEQSINVTSIDSNINDKIEIEFSDIN